MKKLLRLLLLVLCFVAGIASAQTFYNETSFTDDFNILNYKAQCDGSTDDTDAINNAVAAARADPLYTSGYGVVTISGPNDTFHQNCLIGANGYGINLTGFNVWNTLGNGLSAGRVILRSMNLLCSDVLSMGVDCVDAGDSINVVFESSLSIQGNATNPPATGIKAIGQYNGHPCCVHLHREQVYGSFKFAAFFNSAAESSDYEHAIFANGYTTRGSINVATISNGGSGYDGGATATFNAVPLTGGGGRGAIANITVTSGIVTAVKITNQGTGFFISDTLSASNANLGGSGSGFVLALSSIVNWAVVMDGSNHWNVQSHWLNNTR